MAKIAQVSSKYIIYARINIDGVVDRPDVIGAVFGQTEGLLGADLELRELQRSGRIGRIEVNVETKGGKTTGEIIIPSSLDKAETAIVGAALEIIERIGPCNAKINVQKVEDVRISKRKHVIDRAKQLLKSLMEESMPDSQELSDEVAYSVRVMEIGSYGKDKLPAGPGVEEADEVIVVEGRADVLNLLKHGFKNVISMNGTSVPETIKQLGKEKTIIAFVDGDRGGDLLIKELLNVTELDFATKAPDGKEVEELTKKEIHKALRSKIAGEQAKHEFKGNGSSRPKSSSKDSGKSSKKDSRKSSPSKRTKQPSSKEKEAFAKMTEDLIGTRGAYVLDDKLEILGKVPVTELESTLKSLKSAYAVVFDGSVDKDLVTVAEKARLQFLIGMDAKADSGRVTVMSADDF